jgi:branched-chain amino acid transport system ATP-binding protein
VSVLLALVEVEGGYGPMRVLHGVSLEVRRGEIVTLVGTNGAGKTTLMNTVMGVLPVRSGEIHFAGEPISHVETRRIVRRGIALVPERRQLFYDMTVEDNLRMGLYARRSADIDERLTVQYGNFPRLAERSGQLAHSLSGGEQQMLALARAMMSRPAMLLLDEPTLGLAPLVAKDVIASIVRYRDSGGTVLLVEQNARAALEIADRGYVIDTGRVVREGRAAALLADPTLAQAYLGVDAHMERRIREAKREV